MNLLCVYKLKTYSNDYNTEALMNYQQNKVTNYNNYYEDYYYNKFHSY